jgi:hypothetical protein
MTILHLCHHQGMSANVAKPVRTLGTKRLEIQNGWLFMQEVLCASASQRWLLPLFSG